MDEHWLQQLTAYFNGTGDWGWLGGESMRTYPGADAEQQRLYDACRELEARGLVRRIWQKNRPDGAVILFGPAKIS